MAAHAHPNRAAASSFFHAPIRSRTARDCIGDSPVGMFVSFVVLRGHGTVGRRELEGGRHARRHAYDREEAQEARDRLGYQAQTGDEEGREGDQEGPPRAPEDCPGTEALRRARPPPCARPRYPGRPPRARQAPARPREHNREPRARLGPDREDAEEARGGRREGRDRQARDPDAKEGGGTREGREEGGGGAPEALEGQDGLGLHRRGRAPGQARALAGEAREAPRSGPRERPALGERTAAEREVCREASIARGAASEGHGPGFGRDGPGSEARPPAGKAGTRRADRRGRSDRLRGRGLGNEEQRDREDQVRADRAGGAGSTVRGGRGCMRRGTREGGDPSKPVKIVKSIKLALREGTSDKVYSA